MCIICECSNFLLWCYLRFRKYFDRRLLFSAVAMGNKDIIHLQFLIQYFTFQMYPSNSHKKQKLYLAYFYCIAKITSCLSIQPLFRLHLRTCLNYLFRLLPIEAALCSSCWYLQVQFYFVVDGFTSINGGIYVLCNYDQSFNEEL